MGIKLFHVGFQRIPDPDIYHGRKNADFGQGFYLTLEEDFAKRWARQQKGEETILNTYELETQGLVVHSFERDLSWAEYIFANRSLKPDVLGADVVVGPIANDTIYDTFGIISSGFLSRQEAMRLLLIGPVYRQLVIKTQKAKGQLTWLSSRVLTPQEVAGYRETVEREEAAYQELFAKEMERL